MAFQIHDHGCVCSLLSVVVNGVRLQDFVRYSYLLNVNFYSSTEVKNSRIISNGNTVAVDLTLRMQKL
eukprot:SAG31_NODE_7495_length_1673_cov_2.439009_1_plen_68_part_01